MDMQTIIVVVCVAAAAVYFGLRMYRAIRKGQCACCEGGKPGKGGSCGCGCGK